MLQSESGKII